MTPIEAAKIFDSFESAGRLLVEPVRAVGPGDVAVLGLGDKGAAVAAPLAAALGRPASRLRVGALTLPWRPRVTFGAVTEDDHHYVDPDIVADMALGAREIAQIARAAQAALRAAGGPAGWPPLQGRAAIVVGHALSTGYRALAAAAAAKARGASSVIIAAPCAAGDAAERIAAAATARLVTLHVSERPRFHSADFYRAP